jgi:hypothetical protein
VTISKELFPAIPAMDAYDRGYDAGISNNGENDQGGLAVAIGLATPPFWLGRKFFKDVTGVNALERESGSVILTGHS